MLLLLFSIGDDRYAISGKHVSEIIPLINLKKIPSAPAYIAGLLNLRGVPVPVVDLSELSLGRPAQTLLSTRIIIINYALPDGARKLLGLIAERATEATHKQAADFVSANVRAENANYLGKLAIEEYGMLQLIEPEDLLPERVTKMLFTETVDAQ